jgi:hypothetical protein
VSNRIPAAHGNPVDPRTGAFTREWYEFLRRFQSLLDQGIVTEAQATSLTSAWGARLAALETGGTAQDLLDVLYGTNGIQVLGSLESGVEIRGPDGSRHTVIPGPPGEPGEDSWVPGPKGDKGDKGERGPVAWQDTEVSEPWPLLPPDIRLMSNDWHGVNEFSETLRIIDTDNDGAATLGFWSSEGYQSPTGYGWRTRSSATDSAIGEFYIENWNGVGYGAAFQLTPTALAINGDTVLTTASAIYTIVDVTGTYNAAQTSGRHVLLCDASGGNVTVNLPAIATTNAEFLVKKTDSSANTVTVDGNSGETIDGGTTAVLLAQYAAIDLVIASASAWSVV